MTTKHTPTKRALEGGGRATLGRFRIAPWLNAQFPLPEDSDVVALREKVRSLAGQLAAAESRLRTAELVAAARDGAIKGVVAVATGEFERKRK